MKLNCECLKLLEYDNKATPKSKSLNLLILTPRRPQYTTENRMHSQKIGILIPEKKHCH